MSVCLSVCMCDVCWWRVCVVKRRRCDDQVEMIDSSRDQQVRDAPGTSVCLSRAAIRYDAGPIRHTCRRKLI